MHRLRAGKEVESEDERTKSIEHPGAEVPFRSGRRERERSERVRGKEGRGKEREEEMKRKHKVNKREKGCGGRARTEGFRGVSALLGAPR